MLYLSTILCVYACVFCVFFVLWVVFLYSFLLQYFDTVGWVFFVTVAPDPAGERSPDPAGELKALPRLTQFRACEAVGKANPDQLID